MPTFKRTQKIFEEQGLKKFWKKPSQLLDYELFEARVINPNTNDYHQISDLPVEYRKAGENKKYPISELFQNISP